MGLCAPGLWAQQVNMRLVSTIQKGPKSPDGGRVCVPWRPKEDGDQYFRGFVCVVLMRGGSPPVEHHTERPDRGRASGHGQTKCIEGQQPYI